MPRSRLLLLFDVASAWLCGLTLRCFCAGRWRRGCRRTLRWRVWHGWRLAWSTATIVAWSVLVNRSILQVELSNCMADRAFTAGFAVRPHRSTTYAGAARWYRRSSVVCLSVCLSATIMSSEKHGWADRDAVWGMDSGEPKEACVDRYAYWRNLANTTEPSTCGGDATFLSNYFDHLLFLGCHHWDNFERKYFIYNMIQSTWKI